MALTNYGDISPRVGVYADRRLLERAKLNNILAQFGEVRTLKRKGGQTLVVRRYNKLDSTPVALQEGVTPTGKALNKTDINIPVRQYGDWVGITDVIEDTHEDPVLNEMVDLLGEQAPEMYDKIYYGVLRAGTNVVYANGSQRSDVNTIITDTLVQKLTRILERQEAKRIRSIVKAGPNIGTSPIPASFIAVCHCDLRKDIEGLTGFVPVHKYASTEGIIEGEMGAVGQIRFVFDNNCAALPNAGGAKGTMISTGGVSADVYPVLIFGKSSYCTVPLGGTDKGQSSVQTYVNNPKPITGDELAQRGSVGWKGWTGSGILNDLWMVRLECAATNL